MYEMSMNDKIKLGQSTRESVQVKEMAKEGKRKKK